LDITVKKFTDLSDLQIAQWRELQQTDPALNSPFYTPDFAKAIHRAGKAVYVALFKKNDQLRGVLPFHRGRLGTGIPVGGQISDYQGVIGPFKAELNTTDFFNATGLTSYDFNHLPLDQSIMAQGSFNTAVSPCLDLSDGFDSYLAERRAKKNKVLKNAIRNVRILERDIGTVRVEIDDENEDVWPTLVQWKNQSFEQMGVKSILEVPWARKAFEHIRTTQNSHFAGITSSLYVDNKLAATHFGMRSNKTLHWWFPTYDYKLAKYSPGIVLLLEVAKRAPELGLTKIDLGRGSQPYKKAFANGETVLCEGSIEKTASLGGSARILRKTIDHTISRSSRLAKPARFQRRAFNRLLGAVTVRDINPQRRFIMGTDHFRSAHRKPKE